jgi:hypothetical protein
MFFFKKSMEQFQWIFVLIIGAFILVLFGYIAFFASSVSSQQSDVQSVANLDSFLSSIYTGQYVDSTIKGIGSFKLTCELVGSVIDSYMTIDTSSRDARRLVIFSPQNLQGTWYLGSRLYENPYVVSPVLFITDATKRYVFIDDDARFKLLFDDLQLIFPANATVRYAPRPSEVSFVKYDQTIFISVEKPVLFNTPTFLKAKQQSSQQLQSQLQDIVALPKEYAKKNTQVKIIKPDALQYAKGIVQFYKTDTTFIQPTSYIGEVEYNTLFELSAYAIATISTKRDIDSVACQLHKLQLAQDLLDTVLLKRIELLKSDVSLYPSTIQECSAIYQSVLDAYISVTDQTISRETFALQLSELNQKLVSYTCPLIY